MSARGYREEELVTNRVSLLLSSGTEEERRHWAEEAASHFPNEGPLTEVRSAPDLAVALRRPRGVVFIPDVVKLGLEAQALLLRCLQMQEERPKLVLGLMGSAETALERGSLREDLHEYCELPQGKKKWITMIPEGGNWRDLPPDLQRQAL